MILRIETLGRLADTIPWETQILIMKSLTKGHTLRTVVLFPTNGGAYLVPFFLLNLPNVKSASKIK